jgi:hypothetical protein
VMGLMYGEVVRLGIEPERILLSWGDGTFL